MNMLSWFLFAAALATNTVYAHHMAPEDVQGLIEDQLEAVDSPHLLTSEDDPSLLTLFPSLDDVDYVAVIENVNANEIIFVVDALIADLSSINEVCDYALLIESNDSGTYTLTVGVDFCEILALLTGEEFVIPEVELEARPKRVLLGKPVRLSWESENADWCVLEDIGEVPLDGTATVYPNDVGRLMFGIECGNEIVTVEDGADVTVFERPSR